MKVMVIIMISIKKSAEKEIDWDALDRCWADRYMEESGHYFSDGQKSYFRASLVTSEIISRSAVLIAG